MALYRKIEELKKKREEVQKGGGEQAMEKQVALGKLMARERINLLLDENSFQDMTCSFSMKPGL
jgi:acetyl-CoA carboxylase carboxyltransferase component